MEGPGQYVGGEPNAIVKPPEEVDFRVALAFPDLYTIGMSNYGARILYEVANRLPGVACERVFAPRPDMEAKLREKSLPLRTLETGAPLNACDLVGFTLNYELGATNILTMLDLGGIPLTRFERGEGAPLVIAGGHVAFNPEPLSDFFDAFFIGEGDEAFGEIVLLLRALKANGGGSRAEILQLLARQIPGVYVPALYETEETADGCLAVCGSPCGAPYPVKRRIVADFQNSPIPLAPLVPVFETVHERITLEIMRGCPNGCRFCQAGMICRPQREKGVDILFDAAKTCYRNTGYDEVGLLSLSSSDYSRFDELVEKLDAFFAPQAVSLSLPSLRVDHALSGIPKRFKSVKKSGFTIAPEAGSDRLRAVINKHVTNDNLLAAAAEAYAQGWQGIKLYFMCGLPTETEDDLREIARLANAVASLRKKGGKHKPAATLSLSNFVPKPHTPFQWETMSAPNELAEKQRLVAGLVNRKSVSYKAHDPFTSHLEGVFSRGDRRLGKVILAAWQKGARLDGWSDHFKPELWKAAFAECGIDSAHFACRRRDPAAPEPWSHLDTGISRAFFLREREKACGEKLTPPCAPGQCAGCGLNVCGFCEVPRESE